MDDIVVVSDLHLGRGYNPETGRYHRLEAFFYDDDFRRFCDYLVQEAATRGRPLMLVINGDAFDLMRIEGVPSSGLTPELATEAIRDVLAGHHGFVAGITQLLRLGHKVVFLPGNHDRALQLPPVQAAVREVFAESLDADPEDRLQFRPWFYWEPGRIWLEHGNQYDPENAFRYFLGGPESATDGSDVPVGTFFQRHLYNAFGSITFIVPSSRANFRYFRWLIINRPRLVARVARKQLPFFWHLIRRVASMDSTGAAREQHERTIEQLEEETGFKDGLKKIDAMKRVRPGPRVARELGLRFAKAVAFGIIGVAFAAGLWVTTLFAINAMEVGFGIKTLLVFVMAFLSFTGAVAILAYFFLRPAKEIVDERPGQVAEAIAELVDVPIVSFGHTHDERIDRIRGNGWYFNTGTWISVFTADELVPRDRVQFTFLRVRDHDAELLHWSPTRDAAVPVVLLEDEHLPATTHTTV